MWNHLSPARPLSVWVTWRSASTSDPNHRHYVLVCQCRGPVHTLLLISILMIFKFKFCFKKRHKLLQSEIKSLLISLSCSLYRAQFLNPFSNRRAWESGASDTVHSAVPLRAKHGLHESGRHLQATHKVQAQPWEKVGWEIQTEELFQSQVSAIPSIFKF